jgi:hypothetical protein
MVKIVISSGHGKHIRGAAGPKPWGLDEVNEARRVVDRSATLMRSAGVKVTTFHDDVSDDQDENLKRITDFHNAQGAHDLDISVHFNSATFNGSNQTSNPVGCEVFYGSSSGQTWAKKLVDAMSAAGKFKNRGAKDGNLYFLNHTAEVAVLLEVAFVNSQADASLYQQNFEAICASIASVVAGQEVQPGPTPPVEPPTTPPTTPPPSTDDMATLKKGSTGPDVEALQRALGVLEPDGDFGPTTETWVKAFQAASFTLETDGIVGPATWEEVDDLVVRVTDGDPPLPPDLAAEIYTAAQTSEIADFSWPDRGIPPPGYIAGMALSFGHAVRRYIDGDEAAELMSQGAGNPDADALAWYKDEFAKLGMSNKTESVDTMRHLFVMMIGLGPRESSGKFCEGRDMSATNTQADTCEAGLFQTSWNIRSFSPAIGPLLPEFWDNPNGFLKEFKEGISPTANNLNSYGSGDGVRYQFLSRFCPLFHVLVTGCGMRTGRKHWGPINERKVTLKKEADKLLREVQTMVEAVS